MPQNLSKRVRRPLLGSTRRRGGIVSKLDTLEKGLRGIQLAPWTSPTPETLTAPESNVPNTLLLKDGVRAPGHTITGVAQIYIDRADGDLKIRFGDGTVKTIVTDT